MKLTQSLLTLLSSTSAAVFVIASPILDTAVIDKHLAPLLSSTSASDHEIPGSYIVVFKKHVGEGKATQHHAWVQDVHTESVSALRKRSQAPLGVKHGYASAGGLLNGGMDDVDMYTGLKHTYNIAGSMMGYSGAFDDQTVSQIRAHPDVEYVEKDSKVYANSETEKNAPWGLARISHRKPLSFGTFNQYLYTEKAGEGVDVYVIDTGTNYEHVDFEGRAKWGKTIPTGDEDVDGNGHGTHCSGTIAGKKYGVSKKANVIAVKVLRSNGSGTMTDVVKGVEWATNAHLAKAKASPKGFKGSAANMSLGGGKSTTLDLVVNAAVDNGIHFAVAAGNDNANACNYSPAAATKAVTVGASTLGDERAYFSNFGKCVDIFAPGLNIKSTWIGSNYATNTISGTSMASPHIAGLLAYFLSLQPDSKSAFAVSAITPAQLKKKMIAISSVDMLSNIPSDTVNLLAWNGGGSSNISEIFGSQEYEVPAKHATAQLFSEGEELLETLEAAVKEELKALFDKAKAQLNA